MTERSAATVHGVDAWHLTGSDDYQSYVVDRAARDGRNLPPGTSIDLDVEFFPPALLPPAA